MTENTQLELTSGVAHLNWGAIWAGVFTFFAIWLVFGALCLAIFAGSVSLSLAMSVWGIVLTIIAMFVAGRTTGQLSGMTNSRQGIMQGMVMFGLAITSALIIAVIGGVASGAVLASSATHASVIGIFSNYGWALFVGLFLGWLAALTGASSAHKELLHSAMEHQHA